MKSDLNDFFAQYGKLSEKGIGELVNAFEFKKIKKGRFLLKQGQICDNIYFVHKGCLRLYYVADDVEITVWFSFENNSAIELSSFISRSASDYYLEAIEDSEVSSLHKSELNKLAQKYPEIEHTIRVFWEDVILNLLKRFTALQKDSAEKRYLDLMDDSIYLKRVPQKYLASYIGVTPTSLSRIRRNLK